MSEVTMDAATVSGIIGIIIATFTFIGAIFAGIINILKVIDRNTVAIDGLHSTVKAQWDRFDAQGCILDEHGNRIVKLETRLEYHEEKVHQR